MTLSISNTNLLNDLIVANKLTDYRNLNYSDITTSVINVNNILNAAGIPFNPTI
jgi:hypothetical protein